jgi:hypothetical protein
MYAGDTFVFGVVCRRFCSEKIYTRIAELLLVKLVHLLSLFIIVREGVYYAIRSRLSLSFYDLYSSFPSYTRLR